MKNIFLLMCFTLLFVACEKEEIALTAPVSQSVTPTDSTNGEVLIRKGVLVNNSVNMEADYRNQIWFDLGTNSIVKTNLRTEWDLAFDCNMNEYKLYLNAALNASVALTGTTDFASVHSDAGLTYKHEHQSGLPQHFAIGNVSDERNVFIIDRGYDPAGNALGKWKVQVTLVHDNDYYFTYSKLNGEQLHTVVLSQKPEYNRTYYSFKSHEELLIEPPKAKYDLCFTQYTHIFENPPLPYSVNGVIINPYHTEVAEEFNLDFSAISASHAASLFYSDSSDIIGYDWKSFNLQKNNFTIHQKQNYLVKDASGNLFKLHFLDFYDENGVKGTPGFEFVRL